MSYTWPETLTFGGSEGEVSRPLRDVPAATRQHLEDLTFTFIDESLA
jgi:hypothetical protein